ncbi:hypothetical protein F5Y00DRAFT_264268 [Daldinia vernicosa]|uniref:uncharacterized protein n=1 Tax=Daldinia vernicosa TaxID=114800 RepID=UPI0020087767|nr:uncharacterized protein F5Y00DRAFT_264268 [Daldinia vernicosa]KAI0846654.1 hypothetical protein F5Y00DRAFT_264268 [Daldinia vernicosa]
MELSYTTNPTVSIPQTFSDGDVMRIKTILTAGNMSTLKAILSGAMTDPNAQRLALAIYERENDHTTIEFRHFQSTMDYGLAWKWIRIVTSLVQVASKPASEFGHKLQLIATEYQRMDDRWRSHTWDKTFG